MRFQTFFVVAVLVVWRTTCILAAEDENAAFWEKLAAQDLEDALKKQPNNGVAKNVIIFVGDGMGIPTITAARIYRGQTKNKTGEENFLSFEKFPHTGLIKTYNVDRQVPDSAATATAIFSGVKAKYETLGVSPNSITKDCNSTKGNELTTILDWAQEAGKDTGIVTTTRLTHATPAALYSKSAHRNWESDSKKPENASQCKDIASQLVENVSGDKVKVILGGGRQHFIDKNKQDNQGCTGMRTDDKNLVEDWLTRKKNQKASANYVTTKSEMNNVDTTKTDFLLGIFACDHMDYDIERDRSDNGQPSLSEMTETAITMLKKNDKGFFLLVEGGRIDHAHHKNLAKKALQETLAFEDAIDKALSMVNTDETLVIVTADHSHVMTINGYPVRGTNILGLGDVSDIDNIAYTTLMYTTGPSATNDTLGSREKLTEEISTTMEYRQLSLIPHADETHGGEDVALYAIGPMAHLFQGVHEQNYIAHVMSYAACVRKTMTEKWARCISGCSVQLPSISLLAVMVIHQLAKVKCFL